MKFTQHFSQSTPFKLRGGITLMFVLCIYAFCPEPVWSQIDCREEINELDRPPIRTDTVQLINSDTYDLEYFMKFIYIDEVRYKYGRSDHIVTAEEREIPSERTVKKNDQLIHYVLQDSCYKIQSIRSLSPLVLE